MLVHFTIVEQFYDYVNVELLFYVEQYLTLRCCRARYRRVTVLPYYPALWLLFSLVNLASFLSVLIGFLMALQWHSSCVKTFVGIWKSGSTKCWLIFANEGLFMTLKRRITFPITEETEHLNLITTPNIQAKCITCKSTVETPFLFFTCVISTLSP